MASKKEKIAARRKSRPKSKRVPVQAFPLNLEREYTRTLLSMVRAMHSIAKPALLSWFKSRSDSFVVDVSEPIGRVIGGVKIEIERRLSRDKVRPGLIAQGGKVAKFNRAAMNAQFGAVLGIDPFAAAAQQGIEKDAIDKFAKDNADLITSIQSQYLGEVEQKTLDAIENGVLPGDLADDLDERFGVGESRARLIARDQMGKLNGALTEARQTSLGVTRYYWRTSRDERVRGDPSGLYPKAIPSHFDIGERSNEGETFSWSDDGPADGNHPGGDFQCRCRAEPDLSALLE